MADKEFVLGNKVRELLIFTNQTTRVVSDDVSVRDVRKIIRRIAELEDIRDVRMVCSEIDRRLEKSDREGFSKSTFRLYGQDMRELAKSAMRHVHSANNKNFQTDYQARLETIDEILDDCSMLQEYVGICTDERIISVKKAGIFTRKIRDVRNMSVAWKRNDGGRARKIKEEKQAAETAQQMEAMRTACEQAIDAKTRRR